MSRVSKYCNNCKLFYGEVALHRQSFICPHRDCRKPLIKINDDMVGIIQTLNRNDFPVINASLENDDIFIVLDRKCRFKSIPQGFTFNSYKLSDNGVDEYAIIIKYSESSTDKTQDELKLIADNIFTWVKSFCNY